MLYFYALLISFFWGITPIIHKVVLNKLNNITVMAITAIFYFLSLSVLVLFNRNIFIKDLKKITPIDYIWIFIAAFFGVFITNFLYYYILKKGEPAVLSALMYTCPVITLIAAYYILNDHISKQAIIGILLIVTGVVTISLK